MYDFVVKDRQIIVNDKYFGAEQLNEYFARHKLKDNYSMEQVRDLIDIIAFKLNELVTNDMLEN